MTARFNDPGASSGFVSDDFDSVGLDPVWAVVDPLGDGSVSVVGAGSGQALLELSVPAGVSHDPWRVNRALRVMQVMPDGDLELEAWFDSVPTARYQIQGLMFEQDADNWLRFDVYSTGSQLRGFAASTVNGRSSPEISATLDSSATAIGIRVTRTGSDWSMAVSYDGATWLSLGAISSSLVLSTAGVFAANHSPSPAFTSRVDYVFDTAAPVVPEDGGSPAEYSVSTSVVGSGSVSRSPDQATYLDGSVVTLTAAPAAGWEFVGWEGDVTSSANPLDVTVASDMNVTARFVELSGPAEYSVSTSVVGSGSVSRSPDQATYLDGSVVTLTAAPAAGWEFVGWEGDVTSSANPLDVTVASDMNVTARFVELSGPAEYSVSTSVVGSGSVSRSPDQATYLDGSVVTLTAAPAAGWEFVGWEGDVPTSSFDPATTPWTEPGHGFRLPMSLAFDNDGGVRYGVVGLDFTDGFRDAGSPGLTFDPGTLVVHEIDAIDGSVFRSAVPHQFDPDASYDATTNARGELIVEAAAPTSAGGARHFLVYFDAAGAGASGPSHPDEVVLQAGLVDEGLPAMSIDTTAATWWYQPEAGGFSSIVDSSGADWVNWNSSSGVNGEYRGVPNLVYPDGYFHPGETGHVTTVDVDGPLRVSFTTISPDSAWVMSWDIYPTHAQATVETADRGYWFLYEGTPGGTVDVGSDFWADSSGATGTLSATFSGDLAAPEWVQIGDPVSGRSLFVSNDQDDQENDSYETLSGTMTVLGFGRDGLSRLLDGADRTFHVGLLETADRFAAASSINSITGATNSWAGGARPRSSPDPIDDTNSSNPLQLTVDRNLSVTARFAQGGPGAGPTITVWDGFNPQFGVLGVPQPAANIRGNVTDPAGVASLSYTVNGSPPSALSMGPDNRRLDELGDFNIELDRASLPVGQSTVIITATNVNGGSTSETVTVNLVESTTAIPLTVDWAVVSSISDAAEIVDGNWTIDGSEVRLVDQASLGYDRLIALGDLSFTDFEMTVPVRFVGFGDGYGTPQSGLPLFGLGLRWQGHTQTNNDQPAHGFYPVGSYAWFRWNSDLVTGRFELVGNNGSPIDRADGTISPGDQLVIKVRVETVASGTQYSVKYWDPSEAEPADWTIQITETDGPAAGSIALISHHVDVRFGSILLQPLS